MSQPPLGAPAPDRVGRLSSQPTVRAPEINVRVHWHNTTRLHGYLRDVPPVEFEAAFYATDGSDQTEVDIPSLEPL